MGCIHIIFYKEGWNDFHSMDTMHIHACDAYKGNLISDYYDRYDYNAGWNAAHTVYNKVNTFPHWWLI